MGSHTEAEADTGHSSRSHTRQQVGSWGSPKVNHAGRPEASKWIDIGDAQTPIRTLISRDGMVLLPIRAYMTTRRAQATAVAFGQLPTDLLPRYGTPWQSSFIVR
eukprot:366548-Chlamydomonas_euryale.AAC.7